MAHDRDRPVLFRSGRWQWYESPREAVEHRLDGPDTIRSESSGHLIVWWTIHDTIVHSNYNEKP